MTASNKGSTTFSVMAVITLLALLLWLRAGKRNKQSPEGPEQKQEREEGPLLDVLALRGFSYIPGGEHLALWEGEELILKREPENPFDPKAVAVLRENRLSSQGIQCHSSGPIGGRYFAHWTAAAG